MGSARLARDRPDARGVEHRLKRSIENSIDPAHNEYVHDTHGFSGERDDYRVHELDIKVTERGVGFSNKMHAPPLADAKMRTESGRAAATFIEAATGHHGPSSVWTYIHPTPTHKLHQYLYETPIDATHTQVSLLTMRNFMIAPEDDQRMMTRNLYVAEQDRKVLEDVLPVETPMGNTHEVFMPADVPIAKYREFCSTWEARGWRIDVDALMSARRRAYAIPSPARRANKGFVIDAVPLMP